MSYREFHYRWEYDLKASPENLWPYVSDTNRFNRDTNVPALEVQPGKQRGDVVRAGYARVATGRRCAANFEGWDS